MSSFCCLQSWLTVLEGGSASVVWFPVGYKQALRPSQGKCTPHPPPRVEGRWGEQSLCVLWSLGRSPPGVSLRGEQSQLHLSQVVTGCLPDGDTEEEVGELWCLSLGFFQKCLCRHSVLTGGASDRILRRQQRHCFSQYTECLSPRWVALLLVTCPHQGALKILHVPTLSSCWPSKAHFANENQEACGDLAAFEGHTSCRWWSQNLTTIYLSPKPVFCPHYAVCSPSPVAFCFTNTKLQAPSGTSCLVAS